MEIPKKELNDYISTPVRGVNESVNTAPQTSPVPVSEAETQPETPQQAQQTPAPPPKPAQQAQQTPPPPPKKEPEPEYHEAETVENDGENGGNLGKGLDLTLIAQLIVGAFDAGLSTYLPKFIKRFKSEQLEATDEEKEQLAQKLIPVIEEMLRIRSSPMNELLFALFVIYGVRMGAALYFPPPPEEPVETPQEAEEVVTEVDDNLKNAEVTKIMFDMVFDNPQIEFKEVIKVTGGRREVRLKQFQSTRYAVNQMLYLSGETPNMPSSQAENDEIE